jgi:YD repeat-containing protein
VSACPCPFAKKTYVANNQLAELAYDTHDITAYQYNRDKQPLKQMLYNGVDMAYRYDSSAREVSRQYDGANGILYSQATAYDKNTNVLKEDIVFNHQQRTKSYAYDAQDRLTQDAANAQYFSYDLNSNIIATNHNGVMELRELNSDDQYTQIMGLNIAYDLNGNITRYKEKTFSYDYSNRLIDVEEGTQVLVSYSYDAENRRVSKTFKSVSKSVKANL